MSLNLWELNCEATKHGLREESATNTTCIFRTRVQQKVIFESKHQVIAIAFNWKLLWTKSTILWIYFYKRGSWPLQQYRCEYICSPSQTVFPLKRAAAQSHQTLCAVKSHSRALTTFQTSYLIYISHRPFNASNSSLVGCTHGYALPCAPNQTFAQVNFYSEGSPITDLRTFRHNTKGSLFGQKVKKLPCLGSGSSDDLGLASMEAPMRGGCVGGPGTKHSVIKTSFANMVYTERCLIWLQTSGSQTFFAHAPP